MSAEERITEYCDHRHTCNLIQDGTSCQICTSLTLASLDLAEFPPSLTQAVNDLQKLFLDYNDLTEIPPALFTELQELRVVSVIGNDLHGLPSNIGFASRLEELYFNENLIKELPPSFSKLKHLKVLNLVGNKLCSLPDDIDNLHSLQKLYVDENDLVSLPGQFGLLNELCILDLESNKLSQLPQNFGLLRKLTILNLGSNKLSVLPDNFGDLESLENLDLSSNTLVDLPGYMKCCHCLKKFYAENNVIGELPDWIGDLPELEEMSLMANHLPHQAIPESFGPTSKKLRDLHMGSNNMTSLPDTIGELESLEKIHLGSVIRELERRNFQNGNWLWKIPDSFGQLTRLTSINLEENQICELPATFGCLINVEFLDLGQNQLHELPETFGNLRSLRVCQLSKNHFQLLPSSFGQLSSLEDLRLDHNMLAELPESFGELKQLKSLDVYKNRLRELPACLESLTNLIRLDVDRNLFDIPYMKIPQLIKSLNYAPLDASQSDNWRGRRSRADMTTIPTVLTEEEVANTSLEGYEQPEEISYNLLRNAMRSSMSLWKSHTSPSSREETETYRRQGNATRDSWFSDCDEEQNEAESEPDGLSYDFSSLPASSSSTSLCEEPPGTAGGIASVEDGEDWDKEIEDLPPAEPNPYKTVAPVPREPLYDPGAVEYQYVGTEHMFLPSAYHAKAVTRANQMPKSCLDAKRGQFDDIGAEDVADSGEKTLVNGFMDKPQKQRAQLEDGQFDDMEGCS